jgi:hypothetical protein
MLSSFCEFDMHVMMPTWHTPWHTPFHTTGWRWHARPFTRLARTPFHTAGTHALSHGWHARPFTRLARTPLNTVGSANLARTPLNTTDATSVMRCSAPDGRVRTQSSCYHRLVMSIDTETLGVSYIFMLSSSQILIHAMSSRGMSWLAHTPFNTAGTQTL